MKFDILFMSTVVVRVEADSETGAIEEAQETLPQESGWGYDHWFGPWLDQFLNPVEVKPLPEGISMSLMVYGSGDPSDHTNTIKAPPTDEKDLIKMIKAWAETLPTD